MIWVGHVVQMEVKRIECEILLGKAEGQTPVERPRCRYIYDMIYLTAIG